MKQTQMRPRWLLPTAVVLCLAGCNQPRETNAARDNVVATPALAVSLHELDNNQFVVRFTNTSADETIRILKPLDGSVHSWIMPYYAFSIDDGQGTKFDLAPRCGLHGLYANIAWPEGYLVKLRPGQSHEERTYFPFELPSDRECAVSFEYVFEPPTDDLSTGQGKYPAGLWRGRAKSQKIVTIGPQPLIVD